MSDCDVDGCRLEAETTNIDSLYKYPKYCQFESNKWTGLRCMITCLKKAQCKVYPRLFSVGDIVPVAW